MPDSVWGGGKKFVVKNGFLIFEIILMFTICFLHALPAGHYVNFFPINGTFQNFNPVRRLLSGQIPYRDFEDYLGMGHLYAGTIITAVFGGDYHGSLIAFSFLTFLSLALFSIMIGKSILKKGTLSVCLTNLVLLMMVIQPLFFVNVIELTNEVKDALYYALWGGNSARFIRALILPIVMGAFIVANTFTSKKNKSINAKALRWLPAVCIGIMAGFSFGWSNDYGISCWVCLAIMTFWVSLSRFRRFIPALQDTIIEFFSSLISLFIFIEVFTLGHFVQWFKSVFGTGGYQGWYYNSAKSFYLFDVDFSYIMSIQAFLGVMYMIFIFRDKGSNEALKRYGIPGFANITCFCAVNEYKLLSGNDGREVALTVLFLTIIYELIGFFAERKRLQYVIMMLSILVGMAWTISTIRDELYFCCLSDKEGTYNASLGGNMTGLYDDLKITNEFLEGEDFWATYASAQEVVENKFQPSGTDYIIHVLGDEKREDYLLAFQEGNFKYTATIRKDYTDWEYWIERANWFFYRELYKDWHPVFGNTYELYWERNSRENQNIFSGNIELSINWIDDSNVQLIIQTDEEVNGIADIFIDYSVDRKPDSRLANFLTQSMLKVENQGTISAINGRWYESNYLRNESAEYIPMTITNGYGELLLTASPDKCVYLNLKQVSCDCIYTPMADMLKVLNLTDENWDAGKFRSGNILLFPYSDKLFDTIESAIYIRCGNEDFIIEGIEVHGNENENYIWVMVDKEASVCKFPAILTLRGNDNAD